MCTLTTCAQHQLHTVAFFVAVGNKNLGRQELNQLAAQFEDEHMECHIRICARLDAERCIKGDIVHSFKIDICTATV